MKRVFFKTFGCRTNIYDTSIMSESLVDFKEVFYEDDADIVVINSCTVTNSADSTVRGYINHLNNINKRVILAGCGAINRGRELQESSGVFGVLGHSKREQINELLKETKPFFRVGNLSSIDSRVVESYPKKSKAFIKIQEGCNFECSYCIIPSVRGRARSQSESRLLEQIKRLTDRGYSEFVLTGTNIGSYGVDTKSSIAKLLKNISKISGVKRVRLGSLEPSQIDNEFMEILDESWLEKHLHIALQHTDKRMLTIMRRRNKIDSDLKLFWELKSRGFALGSDFIVGHPGESSEIWQSALENFKKFPITHIHLFRYSDRDGTRSSLIKDGRVRGDVAKERLKLLESIVKRSNFNFRVENRVKLLVLVEDKKGDYQVGYDQFYNRVYIKSGRDIQKSWVEIEDYDIEMEGNYAVID